MVHVFFVKGNHSCTSQGHLSACCTSDAARSGTCIAHALMSRSFPLAESAVPVPPPRFHPALVADLMAQGLSQEDAVAALEMCEWRRRPGRSYELIVPTLFAMMTQPCHTDLACAVRSASSCRPACMPA